MNTNSTLEHKFFSSLNWKKLVQMSGALIPPNVLTVFLWQKKRRGDTFHNMQRCVIDNRLAVFCKGCQSVTQYVSY